MNAGQFKEVMSKFLGVFVLMILFAIAELAPDINAEGVSPLVGKWAGHFVGSATEHVLRLEGDHSFTWDSNNQLVMSGTWSDGSNGLELRFGDGELDILLYQSQLFQNQQLTLTNDVGIYEFTRQPSE